MGETKTIRVEVTAEDIAAGKRFECRSCPAALAILRHVKDGVQVEVQPAYTYFGNGPHAINSSRLTGFINRFDGREPVWPFAFRMAVPVEVLRG